MSDFDLEHIASNNLSFNEAKIYLTQYFIPLNNGNHAMLMSDGKYDIISDDTVKKVYLKRSNPPCLPSTKLLAIYIYR